MENLSDPRPELARSLPRDAFHEIILVLRGALPSADTDDPAGETRRDNAAIAAVAALRPENAAEGRLAAQFVAADAWALDCLRLAGERRREMEVARKCRAQAMSLMREAKSALRLLLRLQATRERIEADEAAANRAAWAEHGAARMMEEALSAVPTAQGDPVLPVPAEGSGDGGVEVGMEAGRAGGGWKFSGVSKEDLNSPGARGETGMRFRASVRAAS